MNRCLNSCILACLIGLTFGGCAESTESEQLTDEQMIACQNGDSPCEAPTAAEPSLNCCPIDETLSSGMVRSGGAYLPSESAQDSDDDPCSRQYFSSEPEPGTYEMTRNEVGCLHWARVDRDEVSADRDTSNYSEDEMFECQNDDEPCPSPTTAGVFCCPIQANPGCGCSELGGAHDPDGTLFSSPFSRTCGGICDAKYENYRVARDAFGCLVGKYESGGSCLSELP